MRTTLHELTYHYWPLLAVVGCLLAKKTNTAVWLISVGMASAKCRWCEIYWPSKEDYSSCPQCLEATEHSFQNPTISEADAEWKAAQASFGWWLWDTMFSPKS